MSGAFAGQACVDTGRAAGIGAAICRAFVAGRVLGPNGGLLSR
ncbi:MAG TPA: hypothetical protein VE684_17490 [Crenalkalicoccus sp.]|nr:hypothetical protein [Crenalkalicoccus sp.]